MVARASGARAIVAEAEAKIVKGKARAESLLRLRAPQAAYHRGFLRFGRGAARAVSLGYATFDELLTARKVMGRTQAYKRINLVERVPRDEALALGEEKAYALLAYTAATPA